LSNVFVLSFKKSPQDVHQSEENFFEDVLEALPEKKRHNQQKASIEGVFGRKGLKLVGGLQKVPKLKEKNNIFSIESFCFQK
jgi:hypothetical protein